MKEWKATHRIIDKDGLNVGEHFMKDGNKFFTRDNWYHYEKPMTEEDLKKMGWFPVSSFREEDDQNW